MSNFNSNTTKSTELLQSQESGDLSRLRPLKFFTRSRLTIILILSLILGSPWAVPTFANYLETLSAEDTRTVDEIEADRHQRNQQILWGVLLLTFIGGAATFKSLRKMESVEDCEEFFMGDDLDDDEFDVDEFEEEDLDEDHAFDENDSSLLD